MHFCWMSFRTEILATPLQYRTWEEIMYEILSDVPPKNQNPGVAPEYIYIYGGWSKSSRPDNDCTKYNFVFKRINLEKLFKPRNIFWLNVLLHFLIKNWHRFCSNQKIMQKSHTFWALWYNYIKQYFVAISIE